MNDYTDAAERHYLSANMLRDDSPATASHCFGIAAECTLKALMCNLKPQSKKVSGNHLGDPLWSEFANHQTVQAHPSRAALAQQYQAEFNGWDVSQRYLNRTNTQFKADRLAAQQRGAQGLVGLLQLVERGLA